MFKYTKIYSLINRAPRFVVTKPLTTRLFKPQIESKLNLHSSSIDSNIIRCSSSLSSILNDCCSSNW
ncbi:hypothetical protein BLA29_014435 [Euroglyphus maynei]|uniref:Uncharacterized protein n=1 Tax=Euroglyphus maynei TaxID=6958 RepID=A0A1Y3BPX8_EURMA|nr:hypothetical protein BLA29_014435 [Euroglyphus maynei]